MRSYTCTLCILFSVVITLGSCLSSDNTEVTLYDDAAITSFGISTAKIYIQKPDTAYWSTTTDVADYPFEIDQQKGTIVNSDSLPVGIDATKLLVSFSSKNSGTVGIMPVGETSRDSLRYLLTTDSLDFSTPRLITVYASDGSGYRDYTVTVNIHQEYGDSCYWSRPVVNSSIASMKQARAFALGSDIFVVGSDGTSTSVVKWNREQPSSATTVATSLSLNAYKNIAVMGESAYILEGGKLLSTTDFETFSTVGSPTNLKQLVGAGSTTLYAMGTGKSMMKSTDGGATWEEDYIDEDANLLPSEDIATVLTTYPYADDSDYILMAGKCDDATYPSDSLSVVWRKIDTGTNAKWTCIDIDDTNRHPLKLQSAISLMKYGDTLLEIGQSASGYTGILESRDGGITWQTNKYISLPDDFDGLSTSYAVATTDSQNMIWLISLDTGQIWKGRQNKMGWTAQ